MGWPRVERALRGALPMQAERPAGYVRALVKADRAGTPGCSHFAYP